MTLRVLPFLLVPELRDTPVASMVVRAIVKGRSFLGQANWGPTGQRAQSAFHGFGVLRAEHDAADAGFPYKQSVTADC